MALTHEDVFAILKIIDESPYNEIRLELGGLKLHVLRNGENGALKTMPIESGLQERTTQRHSEPQVREQPALAKSTAGNRNVSGRAALLGPKTVPDGMIAVRAPMLGTFYRSPAPGEPPFVEVGDTVGAEDTVCLVEVMKLFTSVKAGVAGTIVKIEVENGNMVEHAQVLFLIEAA